MSVFLDCASYGSVAGTVSQNRAGYSGGPPEHSRRDLILGLEIKFDLNVVRVANENLPTGTVGLLVHAIGHALACDVQLHCLKVTAGKSNVIDDA